MASFARTQITNSVFISNQTFGGPAGLGGAVVLGSSSYFVQNSTFQGNRADKAGGALALIANNQSRSSIA